MKTLANTSPFLLLLAPVFLMIMLAFAKVGTGHQHEEIVSKVPATSGGLIKVSAPFLR